MSLASLIEIWKYGNLEIVYNNSAIRNIKLESLLEEIITIKKEDLFEGWQWRLYTNFSFILNCYENYIISNFEKFIDYCKITYNIICHYEKILDIKDSSFNISRKSQKDIFNITTIIFLNNIYDKLQTYKLQNLEIKEEKFYQKFDKYLSRLKDKSLFLDFTTPYDNIRWTSKWKIVHENTEVYFEGIDVYIDSYTKNKNFHYNNTMNNDIYLLTERLKYLKKNSTRYFNIIKAHVLEITEKIFTIFPYNILLKNYKNLILVDDYIFRPKLLKDKDIKTLTQDYLMLSIIPDFLSSYILGFPVISIDIPSSKILQKYMDKIDSMGKENYFKYISENFNKLRLKSVSFDINCGNAKDEDNDHLDLCYEKVIEYNQDDIVSLLNNNVIHYFSCKEFKTILKKRENPYNRQEFNIFYHILENLKFKNKSKKIFSSRGLKIELNGTMKENFEELKEKIIVNEISNYERNLVSSDLDLIYQPIIDMFFNSDRMGI